MADDTRQPELKQGSLGNRIGMMFGFRDRNPPTFSVVVEPLTEAANFTNTLPGKAQQQPTPQGTLSTLEAHGEPQPRRSKELDREYDLLERKKERDKQRNSVTMDRGVREKGTDSLNGSTRTYVRMRSSIAEMPATKVNPLFEVPAQNKTAEKGVWHAPASWRVMTEDSQTTPTKSISKSVPSLTSDSMPGPASQDGTPLANAKRSDSIQSTLSTPGEPLVGSQASVTSAQPVGRSVASLASQPGGAPAYSMRIYRRDGTFSAFPVSTDMTASAMMQQLSRKFHLKQDQYSIYFVRHGTERVLGPNEEPFSILMQQLKPIGYEDSELPEQGAKDNAYAFTFIVSEPPKNDIAQSLKGDSHKVILNSKSLQYVPPALYKRAAAIEELHLSRNVLLDIPEDFAQICASLQFLRLTDNEYVTLPSGVFAVPALRRLNVSRNRLEGVLSPKIGTLTQLVELDAHGNHLTNLPDNLTALNSLTILALSNNDFDTFPSTLCIMSNVRVLDLSYCRLTAIPAEIIGMKKLAILRVVGNRITSLPTALAQVQFNELDLRSNLLQDVRALEGCTSLKKLYIDGNSISVFELPQSLSSLRELTATRNAMTKFAIASTSSALTRLVLAHNKLTQLPSNLSILVQLEELLLDDNHLKALPADLKSLKRLRDLSVARNALAELPADIGSLGMLTQLDLHSNNLRRLPAEFWKLTSLVLINLSSNLLEHFPEPDNKSIPSVSATLLELSLADNRLQAHDLFSTLALLTNLKNLNLAYNELDDLPPTIALNAQLRTLNLAGNFLTSLPDEISSLKKLERLYVNGNKLVAVTAELAQCKMLEVVDVSQNNLKNSLNNPYDWNWNQNRELRHLNLSGNTRLLSSYTGDDAFTLEKLRVLNMNDIISPIVIPEKIERNAIVRRVASEGGVLSYGIGDAVSSEGTYNSYAVAMPDFQDDVNGALYALFDGRNGSATASYCQSWVPYKLLTELREAGTSPEDALRRTFISVNKDHGLALLKDPRNSFVPNDDGCTTPGASGIVAYHRQGTLYIASVGDVMAVSCRGGKAMPLGAQLNPYNEQEVKRIRDMHATIAPNRRLNGVLDVSRAFGHFDQFPVVNANPLITALRLNEEDEFGILATLAFWRVMTYQMAVDIARAEIKHASRAAQKLRDFALSFGATEAFSVMVVSYKSGGAGRRVVKSRSRMDEIEDSTLARLGAEVSPPVGTIALVFTDIKNSTLLWETNPVAMRAAIRVHNEIMRRSLRNLGGYEVKTEGDAFMLTFQDVMVAARLCLTVQQLLLEADWPQEILDSPDGRETRGEGGQMIFRGLSVRMGIHLGAPVSEKDPVTGRMDYFGPVVNRASRVAAAADGGQVVISEDAWKELSSGPNAERFAGLQVESIDMGSFKLKGIEGSERLQLLLPKNLISRRPYYHNVGSAHRRQVEEEKVVPVFSDKKLASPSLSSQNLPLNPSQDPTDAVKRLADVVLRLERLVNPSADPAAIAFDRPSDLAKAPELLTTRLEAAVSALWMQKLGGYSQRIQALLSTGSGQTPHFGRSEDPAAIMAALEFALSRVHQK